MLRSGVCARAHGARQVGCAHRAVIDGVRWNDLAGVGRPQLVAELGELLTACHLTRQLLEVQLVPVGVERRPGPA